MRRVFFFLISMALVIAFLPRVHAGEIYEFYDGIRPLGMGGASIATVNDETALLINPAALGRLRDYYITVFDPEVGVGSNTEKIVSLDALKMSDPQKALDKSNAHTDNHLHERAQIFPSIVVPNFGFGVLGKYVVDADVNSSTNKFTYNYTNDYAAVAGFNFRFWDGIIKVGANARVVNHTIVRRDDIDATSTNLSLKSLASSGMGIGSDVSLMLAAPVEWLPTIAAVYRDVGRTAYTFRDGLFMNTDTTPDSTPQTLDVALGIYPILGNGVRSTWSVQLDDATNSRNEKDIMRRLHAGFEINYADALFFRAGMNQRYWTAGLELAIVNYQFQAASYGEDIGDDGSPREDRRYVVKFAFRF